MRETVIVLALIALLAYRERTHRQEVKYLIRRLQEPEIVAREDGATRERKPVKHVSIDDDAAFKKLTEERKNRVRT